MYLLIYVSTATKLLSDDELTALLEQSRASNRAKNITGLLLYNEGTIMQFLEGAREDVLSLMEKIRSDPRHHGLIVVMREEHGTREFTNWAMAYQKIGSVTSMEVPGYGDYINLPLTSEKFLTNPTKTLELLLAFKKCLSAEAAA